MRVNCFRRREFIAFLSGAAVAWPFASRAQQPMPVVGFLSSLSRSELTFVMPAFHQGLNAAGFVDGRNIVIEYRWAEGHYERLPGLAAGHRSRPGGNITGGSFYTSPVVTKRLELGRELVPRGTTIATLVNPDNPPSVTEGTTLQEAAATLGQPIQILNASTEAHIDDAFAAIVQQRIGALIVSPDPFFFVERKSLSLLTARHARRRSSRTASKPKPAA